MSIQHVDHPPADRIAKRATPLLNPTQQRAAIARLYRELAPANQAYALEIIASLPRLLHGLAVQGALAAPGESPVSTPRSF